MGENVWCWKRNLAGCCCRDGTSTPLSALITWLAHVSQIYNVSFRADSESFCILSARTVWAEWTGSANPPVPSAAANRIYTGGGGGKKLFEIFLNIHFCLLFLSTSSSIIHSACSSAFFKPLSWRNVSIYQLVRVEWLSRPSHPLSLPLSCNSVRHLQRRNLVSSAGFALLCVWRWNDVVDFALFFALRMKLLSSDSSLVFLCVALNWCHLHAAYVPALVKKAPAFACKLGNWEIEMSLPLFNLYISLWICLCHIVPSP